MEFPEIPLHDITADQFSTWCKSGIVLLVGSWVSTYDPTSLPSGGAWAEELWDVVFSSWDAIPRDLKAMLKQDFYRIPFEALMEAYPDRSAVRSMLCKIYGRPGHNSVHALLGAALARGQVDAIITTNYDLGIDESIRVFDDVGTVIDEATHQEYRNTRSRVGYLRAYFKIHGTATPDHRDSLVCDLSSERRLPNWKRTFFHELLRGKTLIVIGYSGRDFDICREISLSTEQTDVIWLDRSRSVLQPMARDLLQRRAGKLIIGDLVAFLTVLFKRAIEANEGNGFVDLSAHLDSELIPAWRLRLLNWMALGDLALTQLKTVTLPPLEFMRVRADLYGHIGRYRDGARSIEDAVRLTNQDSDEGIRLRVDASGAWFIYGAYLRAWKLLRSAKRQIRRKAAVNADLVAAICETRMMMRMKVAQIASSFHLRLVATLLRVRSRALYRNTRSYLESLGAHGRLQALEHNAERLGLTEGDGLALPTAVGFYNLGLAGMNSIAQRDRLRNQTTPWQPEDIAAAQTCAERAESYGWHHEAWKFRWLLARHGPPEARMAELQRFRNEFNTIQYHWGLAPVVRRLNRGNVVDKPRREVRQRLWLCVAIGGAAIVCVSLWRRFRR